MLLYGTVKNTEQNIYTDYIHNHIGSMLAIRWRIKCTMFDLKICEAFKQKQHVHANLFFSLQ